MFLDFVYLVLVLFTSTDKNINVPLRYSPTSVSFRLYTPLVSNQHLDETNMRQFQYPPSFKIIVHGWAESPRKKYMKDITEAYLKRGNYSIIQVDWSILAFDFYVFAAKNAMSAGKRLAKLIVNLRNISGRDFDDFHLIGHSLGAHVTGSAGKEVFKMTGAKIGRITGLDPARPLYESPLTITGKGLEKNDATFVDIIHTDGGVFGIKESRGTVDFYPNDGVLFQPGCLVFQPIPEVRDFITELIEFVFCSHKKSHAYYITSLLYGNITGVKCISWSQFRSGDCDYNDAIPLGEDTPRNASGKYFLVLD